LIDIGEHHRRAALRELAGHGVRYPVLNP
jgi:hypothetical protein